MHLRKMNVLAGLLVLILFLQGCRSIIQPSRSDIVEANREFLSEQVSMNISLNLINGNIALYYGSDVAVSGDAASWDGKATVYFLGNYFQQQCVSVSDAAGSYKQWRNKWLAADVSSPAVQIETWLQDIENGDGAYLRQAVVPSEYIDALESVTSMSYCIHLEKASIDWRSLVDVYPDSLFGGEELLSVCSECDVYLFLDPQSLLIHTIYLTKTSEDSWTETVITLSQTDKRPEEVPLGYENDEGFLAEEWDFLGDSIASDG